MVLNTNPGVAHQDRRNYLVEGILEAVPETLFLDARFELQDTSVAPGGNNPSTQQGSLVTVSASWLLYQNIRVIAEYDKQRGEGLDVLDLGELTTVADRNQQRYLLESKSGSEVGAWSIPKEMSRHAVAYRHNRSSGI